jgi:hypothetical protein
MSGVGFPTDESFATTIRVDHSTARSSRVLLRHAKSGWQIKAMLREIEPMKTNAEVLTRITTSVLIGTSVYHNASSKNLLIFGTGFR